MLFLCRSLLRTDAERGDTAQSSRSQPGQYWRNLPKEWKLRFKKKLARVVSMYPLWKKICQKDLKVAKYSAKVALVTRELMAEGGWGGSPQINERMGNTGGFLWECQQFSSSQNEPYESCWARGDFPIVNRDRMVSFSLADKKSVRG